MLTDRIKEGMSRLGVYSTGNIEDDIWIYNDTKCMSDGRDTPKIQGRTFRIGYSAETYNAMLKDGYKKVGDM